MARDISVSIAVQGEKEFNQALKNAQSAVKVLASELKASEAAFDENADAQAYFASRNKNINAQIEQERTILRSLEQAVREAGEEFGEASAKTDKYRIEINRTQASVAKLEKALRESQREAEELGRDSTRVGRQIENGLGDAAEDVSDKLEQMTQMLERDLGQIGSAVEFSALKDLGELTMGALDGMASFVEGTEDYRRSMSFLELNAKNAGFEFEYVKGLLMDVSALTGDIDGAFEGVSNLLAIGFDAKEMEEAIGLLAGAVIQFPETMKFENLAESLQETIATGEATGAYAELLGRLGVDVEEFKKAMDNATTAEERQQIALAYLNKHGLEEIGENYKDANENLIELERTQLEYNDALAGLGTALEPVTIAWTKFKTGFVTDATEMVTAIGTWYSETKRRLEEGQSLIESVDHVAGFDDWNERELRRREERDRQRALALAETPIGASLDWWGGLWDGKGDFWDELFSGGKQAAAKEAGEIVGELVTGLEDAAESKEGEMQSIGGSFIAKIGDGFADGVQGVADTWTGLKTKFISDLTDMIDKFEEWQTLTSERQTKLAETVQAAVDESGLQQTAIDIEEKIIAAYESGDFLLANRLIAEKEAAILQAGEIKKEAVREFEEAEGPKKSFLEMLFGDDDGSTEEAAQAVDDLTTDIEDAAKEEEESMKTIGGNFAAQISSGLADGTEEAVSAAHAVWQAVNDELTRPITMPAPKMEKGTYDGGATLKGGGNGPGGSSHVELVAQIDKVTVARATSGEMNALFGENAERAERYG